VPLAWGEGGRNRHDGAHGTNCNKEIPGVTDYEGTVGVPAGQCYHCHTGRCPVGITTQDPELRKRLVVEEASDRVYNLLTAMTMELQMLARACGKTDVHSLEPEDLAALTVEASAMARVPLAGTNYTVGQTEHEILAEVKRLLAIKAEEELVAGQSADVADLRAVET
jgi:methylamine---glutamate N-methyltransferase subunit C